MLRSSHEIYLVGFWTHSHEIFVSRAERIGQPAVDLVNERGESVSFVVLAATYVLDFSLSQMVLDAEVKSFWSMGVQ